MNETGYTRAVAAALPYAEFVITTNIKSKNQPGNASALK